jgi:hypothetical protein
MAAKSEGLLNPIDRYMSLIYSFVAIHLLRHVCLVTCLPFINGRFVDILNRLFRLPNAIHSMKKIAFLCTVLYYFVFNIGIAHAQADCFPINGERGQIEHRGRVAMGELSMNDVYSRILVWGITKAAGGKEVLKDRDAGVLKFQVQVNYKYKDIYKMAYYSISLLANEGYFEYTINGFMMNEKPLETYMAAKADDQVYRVAFNDICDKLKVSINELKHLKPEE